MNSYLPENDREKFRGKSAKMQNRALDLASKGWFSLAGQERFLGELGIG
jgi:hypothetical protein